MAVRKVYIENDYDGMYGKMFHSQGWETTDKPRAADLIQFTGGEDVFPILYQQGTHRSTKFNYYRDKREQLMFKLGRSLDKPMAGICRGGQFLNVMCGGKMFQDVDNHAYPGGHDTLDIMDGTVFHCTSTHHQMMWPNKDGSIIAAAFESTNREWTGLNGITTTQLLYRKNHEGDPEVVWYEKDQVLCFQPHPEFAGVPKLTERYFYYLDEYLF